MNGTRRNPSDEISPNLGRESELGIEDLERHGTKDQFHGARRDVFAPCVDRHDLTIVNPYSETPLPGYLVRNRSQLESQRTQSGTHGHRSRSAPQGHHGGARYRSSRRCRCLRRSLRYPLVRSSLRDLPDATGEHRRNQAYPEEDCDGMACSSTRPRQSRRHRARFPSEISIDHVSMLPDEAGMCTSG